MLTVVQNTQAANDDGRSSRSLLDEIVRDGARQMLAAALRHSGSGRLCVRCFR